MFDEALAPVVGVGVTLMVNVLGAPLQLPLLPVTVYTVVDAGLSVLVPPEPVGSHAYVAAPVKVTTTGVPLQTVVLVRDGLMVGVEVTFTEMVLVELQLPLVPVTVYTVVVVGVTAITVVVKAPGCHE